MFFNVFIFILGLGLAVGSFLNCVIYRLESNQSFLTGRSFCPKCKHVLAWYDLVPVLSFLWLSGKCRYCKKPISLQYPLVELATSLLFVLLFWHFGLVIDLMFGFLISAFLVIIFVYDLKHYLIPDKVIYPAISVALVYDLLISDIHGMSEILISAFGAAAFFAVIVFGSRGRWMGAGDIKLAFLTGLLLGWPNILVALFFAFFSGAIIGIGLILANRKSFKSEVPFGPFLVAGTLIALFWGERIINWYLSFYV